MSEDQIPIVSGNIDTAVLPEKDQFAAFREEHTIMDIERNDPYDTPFHYNIEFFLGGDILYNNILARTPHSQHRKIGNIARDGVDAICLHLRRQGPGKSVINAKANKAINAGDIHVYDMAQSFDTFNQQFSGCSVLLDRSVLLKHLPALEHLHGAKLAEGALLNVFKSTLHETFRQMPNASVYEASKVSEMVTTLIVDLIRLQITSSLDSDEIHDVSVLRAIMQDVDKNLHNQDYSSVSLSHSLGISKSKLYRLCQPYDTPADLIRRARLKRAAGFLRKKPGINIEWLAYEVGFSGRQAFTRAFKSHFSISPKEYRESFYARDSVFSLPSSSFVTEWEKLKSVNI